MSKLGYIQNSYGKEIKIVSANKYAYNVLAGSNLPDNILILTSLISQENEDIGSYSIVITDYISNPTDIKEDDETIYVDSSRFNYANNETESSGIFIGNNENFSDQENLHKSDSKTFCTLIGNDEVSIKKGIISINTEKLDGCSEYPGIVISDNNTIDFTDDSELTINTQNLKKVTIQILEYLNMILLHYH